MEFHVDVIFPSNAHTGVGRLEKEITILGMTSSIAFRVSTVRIDNIITDEKLTFMHDLLSIILYCMVNV